MTLPGFHDVTMVGFFGSESIGKTSTAYTLAGRLRSHDLLAEVVTDSSAAMPFPPERFDTHWPAWVHVITKKIARECEYALRPNVKLIISDRTPIDLAAYFSMKHPEAKMLESIEALAKQWMNYYDHLYFFPAAGTSYRYDEFREESDDSRRTIDQFFLDRLPTLRMHFPQIEIAGGSYRERAEFVYHDLLHKVLGKSKPKRIVEQLQTWLAERWNLKEVRILGSRSIMRSHVASDTDDFDVLVVLTDPSPRNAQKVHAEVLASLRYLENFCEASLDIKVVACGMEPHEV